MPPDFRSAAVAGSFYPESAATLVDEIDRMLAEVRHPVALLPKAVIVPHAGYAYSGPVAAQGYALLRTLREKVRRVLLLGPTHRVAVTGLALPESRFFVTPLGKIPVDKEAIAAIEGLPQVVFSTAAHAQEHSLEVQLPFLQKVLDHFSLLPLAVGQATPQAVAEVLDCLWGEEETLIVVSSDLSHYLPYACAKLADEKTAQQILALDPTIRSDQACGASPINGLLLAAREHKLKGVCIDLRNSGDTAADKSQVVGYGAFAFSEAALHG